MDEQLIDEIIRVLDIKLSEPNFKLLISILQPCEPAVRIKLWEKEYQDKRLEIMAPKVILRHLQMKQQKALQIHPPGMQQYANHMFTIPPPNPTLGYIPQYVRDNTAKADHKQRLAHAGIKKQDSRKSIAALNKIESTMARLDYMSKEERKQVFVNVQAVVLLNIITELVRKNEGIGVNFDYLKDLEIKIRNGERPIDDMYNAIHEYIRHMYHAKSTPSTTSADLLQFIKGELPVLSASMSSYYQGEKDIIDFKIFLTLLEKYIELGLRESLIVLESILLSGDSIKIVESIIGIISQHICAFVRVAGEPHIIIRPTVLNDIKNLIIEGVRNFLSNYRPPPVGSQQDNGKRHDTSVMTDAGGSLNRNRNHSPIKKYKNRTKHRTKRRTKYRTKRKTKYRTSRRYKIKNKKTRKIYKY
jgi:hypothetical protein